VAVGVDFSREELARLAGRAARLAAEAAAAPEVVAPEVVAPAPCAVLARAEALPFADASFDAAVCHLAFMLMDPPAVVRELSRVLAPGGRFAALLGGGPVAEPADPSDPAARDAFHRFLAIAGPRLRAPRLGDPRVRSERGFRELFAGWAEVGFERWEVDLGGSFDEVWAFLGASYELPLEEAGAVRAELAASIGPAAAAGRVPCRIVTWLGTARRPAKLRRTRGRGPPAPGSSAATSRAGRRASSGTGG
ncbi:MAG TPA: methyltransferase domain-containing protein, partial [Kofleriaceae bacterium]|nr:methyltransferase domain-containing protein [Kofleriaceae bacterium]